MTTLVKINGNLLIEDLYYLVYHIDPYKLKEDMVIEIGRRIQRLQNEIKEFKTFFASHQESPSQRLIKRLGELQTLLEERKNKSQASFNQLRDSWIEFRSSAVPIYERVYASLEELKITVPKKRLQNYTRNVFHGLMGVTVVLLIQLILPKPAIFWSACGFFTLGWTLEITRRIWPKVNIICMKILGKMAHPHEEFHVNSSTWYVTALFVLSIVADPMTICIAVIVLGLADPMAAVVGRRYGRIKIKNNRSLEGSVAFFCTAFVGTMSVLAIFYQEIALSDSLIMAAVAGLVGAITEAYSGPIDDNLSIPIFVALAMLGITGFIL